MKVCRVIGGGCLDRHSARSGENTLQHRRDGIKDPFLSHSLLFTAALSSFFFYFTSQTF